MITSGQILFWALRREDVKRTPGAPSGDAAIHRCLRVNSRERTLRCAKRTAASAVPTWLYSLTTPPPGHNGFYTSIGFGRGHLIWSQAEDISDGPKILVELHC